MVEFSLNVKEDGKSPESIISRDMEGSKAYELFSEVTKKFSGDSLACNRENQPYLYMRILAIKDNRNNHSIANSMEMACFKMDVMDEVINFINND